MFPISDEAEMLALGARLGAALRAGDVIALSGGLGAGKTTLARGLVQAAHPDMVVPSPTYTLVQTYDMPNYELWHCDLYRIEHPDEAYEIGLVDAMDGDAVCLLEWPDRIGDLLPTDAMKIEIAIVSDRREVKLSGWGDRHV
jgi:tRNA threonylcarbamoyladenosine biosynthesis protein TsaE